MLQPLFILNSEVWEESRSKRGSAVLVPGRKLGEVLGKQSVDTADGAGAGMLLQPHSDALWGQERVTGKTGEQESSWRLKIIATNGEALQQVLHP